MENNHIVEDTKKIVFNIIEEEYTNYLKENKILLINKDKLKSVINDYYINNSKIIKSKIREDLKNKYKDEYKSSIVENIILDLFQEKDINIEKITKELDFLQNKNLKKFDLPIINKSLNLNISLVDNYVVINSTNPKNITQYKEIYDSIEKYKFLYSINNFLLEDYPNDEKINFIKKNLQDNVDKNIITIECYYLKNE